MEKHSTGHPARILVAMLVGLGMTVTAGCQSGERPTGGPAPAEPPGGGPLVSPSNLGLRSIYVPSQADQWVATFGSLMLCLDREVDSAVRLDDVTYEGLTDPSRVTTYLRRVPDASERPAGLAWAPVFTRIGAPGHFEGRPRTARGTLTTDLAGERITVSCDEDSPDDAFVELLTSMDVGREGIEVTAVHLDYTVGSTLYRLTLDDHMIACGTAMDPEDCDP